ncbi:alpha/beta hydrolase [Agromyces italicus]|uniref:alpha/beta hydrolase n=1 Tax=Agromyces italicus TaxID=279572 RepID=UPI0012F7AC40|nr:alpha/beta hydrolase [Agromyces italicus]
MTYRKDGEGPTTGSGRSTLGATEVDDVRAAVEYALAHGASRVIRFGWSMGATIALQLAADPELRGIVPGLVLESPVLDWVSTIKANCKRSSLPAWTGALAVSWLDNRRLSRITDLVRPSGCAASIGSRVPMNSPPRCLSSTDPLIRPRRSG